MYFQDPWFERDLVNTLLDIPNSDRELSWESIKMPVQPTIFIKKTDNLSLNQKVKNSPLNIKVLKTERNIKQNDIQQLIPLVNILQPQLFQKINLSQPQSQEKQKQKYRKTSYSLHILKPLASKIAKNNKSVENVQFKLGKQFSLPQYNQSVLPQVQKFIGPVKQRSTSTCKNIIKKQENENGFDVTFIIKYQDLNFQCFLVRQKQKQISQQVDTMIERCFMNRRVSREEQKKASSLIKKYLIEGQIQNEAKQLLQQSNNRILQSHQINSLYRPNYSQTAFQKKVSIHKRFK